MGVVKPTPDPAAPPADWHRIIEAKRGPCRACTTPSNNGHDFGRVTFHRLVKPEDGGGDEADNIVPLHELCRSNVTERRGLAVANLLASLTDAEYSYCVEHGGEDYFERAYGLVYAR